MRGKTPVIGITTYGPEGDPAAFSLPINYVKAVAATGAIPILLAGFELAEDHLLDVIDGLILAGGGDIDPETYGGRHHPMLYGIQSDRDRFEVELLKGALEDPEFPVLAICRGMQVLNVALGGDLEPHLPDVRGESVIHRLPPRNPTRHPVQLESSTVLEEIYGETEFEVCSWHHQEVRRLGSGLEPIAYAADGVVEGLVYSEHSFVVGVQWHPEMQVAEDPLQRRLFTELTERARRKRCD